MSEFTTGHLIVKDQQPAVEAILKDSSSPYIIENLNSQWSVFYLEDDWMQQPETREIISLVSNSTPIFNFVNPEDHGWGYMLFKAGQDIAYFFNSYELQHQFLSAVLEEKYPGKTMLDFDDGSGELSAEYKELLASVTSSEEYWQAQEQYWNRRNIDQFKHFGIDTDTIQKIQDLLSWDKLKSTSSHIVEVDEFMQLLNIKEMQWKSYQYLSADEQ